MPRTGLGMPQSAAPRPAVPTAATGVLFTSGHHFTVAPDADPTALAAQASSPLSVIMQVTKRCNFDCSFCSETLQLPDPTLAELGVMRDNLVGVSRMFLSGGEPLMCRDFADGVDIFAGDFIIGVPTNATRGLEHAAAMSGKVDFVNVGLEGPRTTTNRARGDYDPGDGRHPGIPGGRAAVVAVRGRVPLDAVGAAVHGTDRRRPTGRQGQAHPALTQGQRPGSASG
jgi:hypothetical protein